jgi:ATP-dependent Clp protease adaptor protein ClpS
MIERPLSPYRITAPDGAGAADAPTARPGPLCAAPLRAGDDDGVDDPQAPTGPGGAVVTKVKPKTKKPSMYKVLMLNDDYTPMEFVVYVLERFFGKSRDEATQIMLHVHHRGVGICGVYTYEVAETKVTQVMDTARKEGHPLQCTLEKDA